jgi:hypothetical protein
MFSAPATVFPLWWEILGDDKSHGFIRIEDAMKSKFLPLKN